MTTLGNRNWFKDLLNAHNVDKIKELAFNNNVSIDTLWKDFIVSVK